MRRIYIDSFMHYQLVLVDPDGEASYGLAGRRLARGERQNLSYQLYEYDSSCPGMGDACHNRRRLIASFGLDEPLVWVTQRESYCTADELDSGLDEVGFAEKIMCGDDLIWHLNKYDPQCLAGREDSQARKANKFLRRLEAMPREQVDLIRFRLEQRAQQLLRSFSHRNGGVETPRFKATYRRLCRLINVASAVEHLKESVPRLFESEQTNEGHNQKWA